MAGPAAVVGVSRRDLGLGAIFGVPLALAGLSAIGLIGALLENGGWDLVGAGLLATTLLALAWAWFRRR